MAASDWFMSSSSSHKSCICFIQWQVTKSPFIMGIKRENTKQVLTHHDVAHVDNRFVI